jgi:hypothetical protein
VVVADTRSADHAHIWVTESSTEDADLRKADSSIADLRKAVRITGSPRKRLITVFPKRKQNHGWGGILWDLVGFSYRCDSHVPSEDTPPEWSPKRIRA